MYSISNPVLSCDYAVYLRRSRKFLSNSLKKCVQETEVKFTALFSEVVNSTPDASYLDRDFCLDFYRVNRILLLLEERWAQDDLISRDAPEPKRFQEILPILECKDIIGAFVP